MAEDLVHFYCTRATHRSRNGIRSHVLDESRIFGIPAEEVGGAPECPVCGEAVEAAACEYDVNHNPVPPLGIRNLADRLARQSII